jgi:phosphoesterase RecJ-like protein
MKFNPANISRLRELISGTKKVVIVTHRNPDGDALGSSLGFKGFLEHKGHEVSFISPNAYTSNLKWMHGTEAIMVYDHPIGKKICDAKIQSAEIIFCLDFNTLNRLEGLGEAIKNSSAVKVMIDHHRQPDDFAQLAFCDINYCATAELVYDIIDDLGETRLIDEKIAENLYTGLATDNGFFQFNNTTPNAFMVAAGLVARGARPDYVSEKINNVFRETRLRFLGYCLNEKLKLVKENQLAYMMITQAEIKKYNLQSGDSEGLVNYPFKIEGVKVSVYFSEEPDRIKISFRSRGEIDVNVFARTYFEGGGHRNAAGGISKLTLAATEKKFLEAIDSIDLSK